MVVQTARNPANVTTTPIASYDSAKMNLGTLMVQATDSVGTYVGPHPIGLMRAGEESTQIPSMHPSLLDWSTTKTWEFYSDGASAAATRRFGFYEHTLGTADPVWKGFITVTFPAPAGNHTVRAIAPLLYTYSTGTVAVSGTAVTGTSTAWKTARFCVGARIGFGSTDPKQITTWYEISAMADDTHITLTATAGTIAGGTAFVIEDLWLAIATTNSTAANGGLFLVKGLNYSTFQTSGTAISAASATDLVRACYWLADASTVTNTVSGGLAVLPQSSDTSHTCYVLDGTTTAKFYKYNLRKDLTLSSGKDTTAFLFATAASATLTGTINQNMSSVYCSASHGPGSGVGCIYFTTSGRVYRQVESSLTTGGTPAPADAMQEVPPDGTTGTSASVAMSTLSYCTYLDRFLIGNSNGNSICYLTQYNPSTSGFDAAITSTSRTMNSSSASANLPTSALPFAGAPTHMGASQPYQAGTDKGFIVLSRVTTTAAQNQMYMIPAGAHWQYASTKSQRVIFPEVSTTGNTKFYEMTANLLKNLGGNESGSSPEPCRLYYRTSGISDNSGSWTLLTDSHDLSGVTAASSIQFMAEFKVLGRSMIMNRIYHLNTAFENSADIPGHLRFYHNDTQLVDVGAITGGTIGFIQKDIRGSVPNLQIDYYRTDTGALILSQASTSTTNGTFQYFNGSWVNGLGTDTIDLRRRFVPATTIPSNLPIDYKIKEI